MQMLAGDVVLVVGGGSGLGLGVVRHCLAEGARVAVLEVSEGKVEQLHEEFGHGVLAIRGDVTELADLESARARVLDAYGQVDAVIACQGIFDGQVPIADIEPERLATLFDEVFHVNVLGHLLLARVFHDALAEQHGALVLTSSTAAYAADGGGAVYTATKGAIRSLVGQLAFEFAPDVRVNGVAPAGIAGSKLAGPGALGLAATTQDAIPKDAFLDTFRRVSLLQELPTAEEYGPLYAFLASRHNTIMTGQTIVADQGLLNRSVLTPARA
ncbi:cis-2,3-dihydrobiphenyl-2,3-diol dehydrogenase [Raineyella antarctica]|uniref:Cis-2,3-dihydrobiphenyl-2,3-diol dehydrogenase n=1 Tax=Raineyella antarctica TaxID=1577474 RepID=A0A1G6H177_9ACTN|nr:SDR family oxidoreductase [Raineyella antarctica]SDB87903.1 cis-2,3-dihydrobiphenyl-2,3-diol dehydrogenase [Raineyella antarctica]